MPDGDSVRHIVNILMIRQMKLIRFISLIFVALASLCACLREDRYGCPTDEQLLRISFGDVKPGYEQEIERIDVFIFDSDGVLYRVLSESGIAFTPHYTMETYLPEGEYQLISWSNIGTIYTTVPAVFEPGITTQSEARLALNVSSNIIGFNPSLLLHGSTNISVGNTVTQTGYQSVIIPQQQDTNAIYLTIEGLDENHEYTVMINKNDGRYYFDNNFAPSERIQYTRASLAAIAGKFKTNLTTLRLERDRTPELTITNNNSQTVLFSRNLVDLILRTEAVSGIPVDFSTQHEFNIHIAYHQSTLTATVTINGWKVYAGNEEELE